MSQYLYSLKVGGDGLKIQAPSVDSFNVFDTTTGEATTAELLWQTYDGSSDIITVDPKTGDITPVVSGSLAIETITYVVPTPTGLISPVFEIGRAHV